jgi:hypothetical protein
MDSKCALIQPMNSKEIIKELGGAAQVAKLCQTSVQAVNQWYGISKRTGKERSIPAARLMYLKVIKPAAFKVKKQETA